MKLSKTVQHLLNEQIKNEFESAYIYLGMSAYFNTTPFSGMAKWMKFQAQEELEHGMKFLDYIENRNSEAILAAIPAATCEYKTPLAAFKEAYKHEILVTSLLHKCYEAAIKENDIETQIFLNWFITEQIEEEKQTLDLVTKLELAKDNVNALFAIDREAAMRSE